MIPLCDLRPGYQTIEPEILAAVQRVLASGRYILGPEVEAFEDEFAAYVGATSAIGVASGTDALILALRAIGVGSGDEVVTVANSGVPPVAAIRAVDAVPRFADVMPGSLLIDPDSLKRAFSARTRCVLPVHLYGQAAPLDSVLEQTSQRGIPVIEDCAQAHGTHYRGRHVGPLGAIGCFSFYPTKNLGALGDGGMCVTNDARLAARLRMLRMYGFRGDGHAHCDGLNSRLDEIQAAVLRVKLSHLPAALAQRRQLAAAYDRALADSAFTVPSCPPPGEHSYHLYVVQTALREQALSRLRRHDIGFGIHYSLPVHLMEAYRDLGYRRGDLPVTEAAAGAVLSLPLYPELAPGAADQVAAALIGAADDAP
jgi:dTDP-4-amino-4,6-dideoxygalactose transaminase